MRLGAVARADPRRPLTSWPTRSPAPESFPGSDRTRRLPRPPPPWVRQGAASAGRCSGGPISVRAPCSCRAPRVDGGRSEAAQYDRPRLHAAGHPHPPDGTRAGDRYLRRLPAPVTVFGASPAGPTTRSCRSDRVDRRSSISSGGTTAAGHAWNRSGSHGATAPSLSRSQAADSRSAISVRPVVAVGRPVPTRRTAGAATAGRAAAPGGYRRAGDRQARSAHHLPGDPRQRLPPTPSACGAAQPTGRASARTPGR